MLDFTCLSANTELTSPAKTTQISLNGFSKLIVYDDLGFSMVTIVFNHSKKFVAKFKQTVASYKDKKKYIYNINPDKINK